MIPLNNLENIEDYLNLKDGGARLCQKECFKTILKHDKAIASMITGSGKSFIEYALVNYAFANNYSTDYNCIVTDSILLGQQIALDYLNHYSQCNPQIIIFNSDNKKNVTHKDNWINENYPDVDYKRIKKEERTEIDAEYDDYKKEEAAQVLVELEKIKKENDIISTLNINEIPTDKKVLIISTYDSFDKLKDFKFGITVFDEAHCSDTLQFHESLKALNSDKTYFFTSTPKGSLIDKTGMGNPEIYGNVEYELKLAEAVNQKNIVNFAITTLYNNEYDHDFTNSKSVDAAYKFSKHLINSELDRKAIKTPKIVINLSRTKQVNHTFNKLIKDNLKLNIYMVTSSDGYKQYDYNTDKIKTFKTKLELIEAAKLDNGPYVLLNIKMLNVGIDLPALTTLGLFTSGNSISTLQSIGRILRVNAEDRNSEWSYDKINHDMTKPYGLVYLNISGPSRDHNEKTFKDSVEYLTSEFGSLLYFIEPTEPGSKNDPKPKLATGEMNCNSEFGTMLSNIMLNIATDMPIQEDNNTISRCIKVELFELFLK